MISLIGKIIRLEGLSRRWQIAVCSSFGIAAGMAALLFRVSGAASYLGTRPETCANCHVMTDAYASWRMGSHSAVAVCTDCHLPHGNIVAKTAFKGMDGLKHSYVFTAGTEPQVLEPSRGAVRVLKESCMKCHIDQFGMIRLASSGERVCWDCHDNIHQEVRSLSASPTVLRPRVPSAGWRRTGKETMQ